MTLQSVIGIFSFLTDFEARWSATDAYYLHYALLLFDSIKFPKKAYGAMTYDVISTGRPPEN